MERFLRPVRQDAEKLYHLTAQNQKLALRLALRLAFRLALRLALSFALRLALRLASAELGCAT